ncbi:hypothetical protein K8S19_13005 [bacterium]|nr:hypothetical protein [bacterium]
MRIRKDLPERANYFYFEHKPSEINYGGKMRFQQIAFPPGKASDNDFETLIFYTINKLIEIIQNRSAPQKMNFSDWQTNREDTFSDKAGGEVLVFKNWHAELVDIYFDQWCETPFLSLDNFQKWVHEDVVALTKAYWNIRVNALKQERITGIFRLNYYTSLAMTTLIAEMISEYFDKQVDQLGKLATLARFTIGRCLSLAFRNVEESEGLGRIRKQELGEALPDEGCLRVLNPFVLSFIDIADAGMVEEILAGPNPYQISHALRTQLITLFKEGMGKSKQYSITHLRRNFAEFRSLKMILAQSRDRNRLVSSLRRQRELRHKLVFENAHRLLRTTLREYIRTCPDPADIFSYISNERQLEEIYNKPAVQRRFFKILKVKRSRQTDGIRDQIKENLRFIKKSKKQLFGRLVKKDLLQEFQDSAMRCSEVLCHTEDFQLVRRQYGRDSNRAVSWQGIRIWRSWEMVYRSQTSPNWERLALEPVWEKRRAEIENNYAEGNLFFCQAQGDIYPHAQQRRNRVVFLFADLRNSTETTMKLTKDTASFLTPYLNAVNSSALKCNGQRIYFAGDGYAAYYNKGVEAIRAAYTITAQFYKLRKVSSAEHLREAKDIYQQTAGLGFDFRKSSKIKQGLAEMASAKVPAKVREFLNELAALEQEKISEADMKKMLAKVAAAYSMPRVDVGVALTNGELFLALVGDEKDTTIEKIPIVISPQLTQAARLSGSSDLVRKYIDTHFSQPFPFNAYTWDKKLYNRGIVITQDLFSQLEQEANMESFDDETCEHQKQGFFAYFDDKLKKKIVLRLNQDPVMLKGIAHPCPVYEVATMGSYLDKKFGTPVKQN